MRVISQDGRTDISYDNFVLGITKDNYIVAIRDTVARLSEVAHGVMAKYSTEPKSKKVMEMLRNTYQYAEECKCTGIGVSQPEFVFRFPADSEVTDDET